MQPIDSQLATRRLNLSVAIPPEADRFDAARMIPSQVVRKLCGGISLATLERWTRRPELAFPKARMIGQRRFWVEAEILAWLESREVAA